MYNYATGGRFKIVMVNTVLQKKIIKRIINQSVLAIVPIQ
jgi:hypothetical protein